MGSEEGWVEINSPVLERRRFTISIPINKSQIFIYGGLNGMNTLSDMYTVDLKTRKVRRNGDGPLDLKDS